MLRRRALTIYSGPAGDHNDRAMGAVADVGRALSRRIGLHPVHVGDPQPAEPGAWDVELDRARGPLTLMARRIDAVLAQHQVPVSAITRCAVALATLPQVLAHAPDTVLVWLDAHGDINTPAQSATGYLGGMAVSGPMGWWESGLGAGLPETQVILVGARDLDEPEVARLRAGAVTLVEPGPDLAARLHDVLAGRPGYLHLDCDVLDPGIVATDYRVPAGLTLEDLHGCAEAVAAAGVVGVEIAEYEGPGVVDCVEIVDALGPVL